MASPGERRPGDLVLGRYRLLDPVGAGASGTVWRARDRRTRREVALKVLRRDDRADDPTDDAATARLLRFVREQSVRVVHPHVAAPDGWAADDRAVALTLPLVRGGTVAALVAEHGALPLAWVAVLLDQLLDALDAVHRAGVVHRDVKPANLLLEPTGEHRPHLRLADFGVAAVAGVDLAEPGVVGTDGYLSPEALTGAPPGPRQDLYAAGATALHLLTGRRPPAFGRPEGTPVPDGPLRPVVAALLAADPAERLVSARAARDLLRRTRLPHAAAWPADHGITVPDRLGPAPPAYLRRLPVLTVACLVGSSTASLAALVRAVS